MKNLTARYHRLHRNSRGTLWMLASAASFTVMTMLIKFLGEDYSAPLQTFYRNAAGLIVMIPLIARNPRQTFRTSRPGLLLFRATAGTVGMILGFYAYQKMPLADANALSFTRTLWLVPLAAFVLKEPVGPRRIAATLVGFFGALLMLQPSSASGFGLPAAAALLSALLIALTVTGMKVMTRDHTTMTLMAWSAVLGFVLTIPGALLAWRTPNWSDLVLLSGLGILGLVNQACYIKGMAEGDAMVMAPIDYTRLIFAIVLGYALFGEVPNSVTMLGAGVIIASTLYITWREAQLGQPKPEAQRAES
ncbi:multidrug transporter [Steroidobacter agaridevorans]|uniref:Multidrug transporter n=1 Tax=Steroidobacter agaridevorans TaxID=2695856 RepID=A0A829Y5G6_9GAMM|nr:DMT family transporter [Steroidobacter agaridevorans]GFE78251.1 multidrug transporter [Steroidobacter agaridevorans]GFE91308.1 multidrug transporter [Steroidobacter agaridevorans]